jgi:phage recombination protein Bet
MAMEPDTTRTSDLGGQMLPVAYSPEKLNLIRRTVAKDCTEDEFAFFIAYCRATRLDPLRNQIYAIVRGKGDQRKMTIQTGIDGYRSIAIGTGKYRGQVGPEWCGPDGVWKDVWLDEGPPAAARVGVLHADMPQPVYGVALWKEYRVLENNGQLAFMWQKMPAGQLAKCAEALALRKAFQELSGLYTHEEMSQADNPPEPPQAGGSRHGTSPRQSSPGQSARHLTIEDYRRRYAEIAAAARATGKLDPPDLSGTASMADIQGLALRWKALTAIQHTIDALEVLGVPVVAPRPDSPMTELLKLQQDLDAELKRREAEISPAPTQRGLPI